MKTEVIARLHKNFEDFVHEKDGVEFWYGRDLKDLLGYAEWRNFGQVIDKAKISCESAKGAVSHHFVDVNKMIPTGKGAERSVRDMMLTRYACYLIAQNGDPRKEEIAFAQSYFAVQTRKQEIIEERIRDLERLNAREKLTESERIFAQNLYERGIDGKGIGVIRSKGDKALFGGHTTQEMKNKMHVPENRPIADYLPRVTITAKNLATEMTNFNVEDKDMQGESLITTEHVENNRGVRNLLLERGIVPENLLPEEDVKKLERKVKSQEKSLAKKTNGFSEERV
ncbi:MAG: DNA damage-inducible protein D [Methanosarcinaceae archaeon]|nr:DNA damage-inducible protein D [Methanosarcinaceae archaeon]